MSNLSLQKEVAPLPPSSGSDASQSQFTFTEYFTNRKVRVDFYFFIFAKLQIYAQINNIRTRPLHNFINNMNTLKQEGRLFANFVLPQNENLRQRDNRRSKKNKKFAMRDLDENGTFKYVSPYEIPEVAPYNGDLPYNLVPFCDLKCAIRTDCPHFFIDDNKFSSIIMKIEEYTNRIRRFNYVIAPDYSLFCDASIAQNINQVYKNRAVTCYWQERGIKVIPSFNGGNANSFDYCLIGLPKHSVLATGNVGVLHNENLKRLHVCLLEKVVKELSPTALIIYGTKIEFAHPKELPVYWHEDFIHSKFYKYGK